MDDLYTYIYSVPVFVVSLIAFYTKNTTEGRNNYISRAEVGILALTFIMAVAEEETE